MVALALLTFVTVKTVQGWEDLDKRGLVVQLALPAWLTVGALPFVFLLALYAGYEQVFSRLDLQENLSRGRKIKSRLAVLAVMQLRVQEISRLSGYWLRKVTEAPTFREACEVVRAYRLEQLRETQREAEKKESIKELAGAKGTGSDGLQLDRREFEETTDGLRLLTPCMMGW